MLNLCMKKPREEKLLLSTFLTKKETDYHPEVGKCLASFIWFLNLKDSDRPVIVNQNGVLAYTDTLIT